MLSKPYWLNLPNNTRRSIEILLNLPKDVGTIVEGGRVQCDGHSDENLATIDLERLQTFMKSKEKDFYKLFDELVARIEAPMVEITPGDLKEVGVIVETKKPRKTKKFGSGVRTPIKTKKGKK